MRKLSVFVASLLATLTLGLGAVASAAPVVTGAPAECTGTYSKKVVLTGYGSYYNGTTANELIIINASAGGSYVNAGGGADCVVVNSRGNYVLGGAGQDVIVANAGGNSLNGEGAADEIYSYATGDALNGGTGNDYCEYDYQSSSAKSCEL